MISILDFLTSASERLEEIYNRKVGFFTERIEIYMKNIGIDD